MSLLRQIKASAGSGKTFALTSDFLDLLGQSKRQAKLRTCQLSSRLAWSEILAVTFTNRAATEMQERILSRLKDLALKPGPDQIQASLWLETILRNFGSLNVRTIDSLLHTLVRLGSLQLSLPPDFQPIFSLTEALEPLLDQVLENGTEVEAELLRQACEQLFYHTEQRGFLLGSALRPTVLDLVQPVLDNSQVQPATAEQLQGLLQGWLQELHELSEQLLQVMQQEGLKPNQNLLKALAKSGQLSLGKVPLESAMFTKDSLSGGLLKASKQPSEQADSLYLRLCTHLNQLNTQGLIVRSGLDLLPFFNLASQVAGLLPNFLRQSGSLPADFVPRLVRQILSGQGVSEALCRLGTRLSHILIDEFQDTNFEQWTALKPLLVEALSKGGSLIFVGDVKQAIYGWRGGDSSLFNAVLQDEELSQLVAEPQLTTLPNNWRSCAAIVQQNNEIFSQLQNRETIKLLLDSMLPQTADQLAEQAINEAIPLIQATFTDCAQKVATDKQGCFEVQILQDPEQEALSLAVLDLVQDLSQSYAFSDLAVLVRSNKQASLVASWLLQAGWPVVTENSFLLAEHPVIIELVALLSFLTHPTDTLALAVFLQGKHIRPCLERACAEQDCLKQNNLEHESLEQNNFKKATPILSEWLTQTHSNILLDFQTDFPLLWSRLEPFYTEASFCSAYDLVQAIIQTWHLETVLPAAITFLRRFLEIIHLATTPKGQSHSLSSFLNYWQLQGKAEKAPMPENLNAIRIMTIHKAKGLQFPVVIVPWHDFKLTPRSKIVLYELGKLQFLTRTSKAFGLSYYQQWAANVREAFHLLYVAWTRAECEFYGFVQPKSGFSQGLVELLGGENLQFGQKYRQIRPSSKAEPTPTLTCPIIGSWRPLGFMPRLKIFRNPLAEYELSQNRRGIFVHHALSLLNQLLLRHEPHTAAPLALQQALDSFPLPVTAPQIVLAEIEKLLLWYAQLPQAKTWSLYGHSEQELVNTEGQVFRADLIVNNGQLLEIIDYKTGEPHGTHTMQVHNYLSLAQSSQNLPVQGWLVYLDSHQIVHVPPKI